MTVLGFSKYALMINKLFSDNTFFKFFNLTAYSFAASTSCIEQGPTTIINFLDFLSRISLISDLVLIIVSIPDLEGESWLIIS
jgi:hypothetical protein